MSEEEKARLPHEMMEGLGLVDTSEADSDLMPGGTKRALESDEAAQGEVTEKSSTKRLATEQGAVNVSPGRAELSLSRSLLPTLSPSQPPSPPRGVVRLPPSVAAQRDRDCARHTETFAPQNASAAPSHKHLRSNASVPLSRANIQTRTRTLGTHATLALSRSNQTLPHRGPHSFAHALACMDIFSRIGPRATLSRYLGSRAAVSAQRPTKSSGHS